MGKTLDPEKNRFGPYALVEELAVGGMAEVFLANHHALDGVLRKVVVKRMLDQFSDDEEFRSMFLHEARLMAALSHPNIAQIYDVGRDQKRRLYLVMEYIQGPTLRELIYRAERSDARKVPRSFAICVALAMAEGLHYVHTRRDPDGQPLGIVHRDLNPANVMVTHDGAVKLIDFGIAKAASSMVQTATGIVKGTRGYMAPEQITGRRVDHRADIFNLGVILYELLLGRHPFESENRGAQLLKVVEGRWTPPSVYEPDFPEPLATMLDQCLAADRDERLASMAEVIDQLAHHQRQEGLSTSLSELGAMVSRWVPSDRLFVHLHRQVDLAPAKPEPQSTPPPDEPDIMELTDPTLIQPVLDDPNRVSTTEVTRLAGGGDNLASSPVEVETPKALHDDASDQDDDNLPTIAIPKVTPEPKLESIEVDEAALMNPEDGSRVKTELRHRITAVDGNLLLRSRSQRFGHGLVFVLALAVVGLSVYLAMLLNE